MTLPGSQSGLCGEGEERLALGERIASGSEAEIFALDPDRVVRLLRSPAAAVLEQEEAVIKAVGQAGVPVANTFGVVNIQGRPGLVQERLDGKTVLQGLQRAPWRAWALGRLLGATHARLNAVRAPDGLPSEAALLERLRAGAQTLPPDLRDATLGVLASLPDGEMLCHGDFKPGNVVLDHRRGPVIVDWVHARRGSPERDVARTLLVLRFRTKRRPPVTGIVSRGFWALVGQAYLQSYAEHLSPDMALVHSWQAVWAARLLVLGRTREYEALARIIRSQAAADR